MRLLLPLVLILTACVQPHRATSTLETAGFKDIQIIGYNPYGCHENEDFAAGFFATLDGRFTEGTVCHEPFGQDIIRFWEND